MSTDQMGFTEFATVPRAINVGLTLCSQGIYATCR